MVVNYIFYISMQEKNNLYLTLFLLMGLLGINIKINHKKCFSKIKGLYQTANIYWIVPPCELVWQIWHKIFITFKLYDVLLQIYFPCRSLIILKRFNQLIYWTREVLSAELKSLYNVSRSNNNPYLALIHFE